jgi:hypothetical protein
MMSGWDKLIPPADPKPITLEDIRRGWEIMLGVASRPPEPPVRIVSYAVYKRAEDAIAAGASPREVEWVLHGATLDQARAICKETT